MTSRVAVVTGAGRGIGAATVAALLAQDYRVVAVDWCAGEDGPVGYAQSTGDDLAATADDPRVRAVTGDVRDRAALDAAVRLAVDTWGRLDAAVAAAAVVLGGRPLWETPAADLDLLWQIDAVGVWNTAAAAVPALLAHGAGVDGRFVAIASAAGHEGLYGLSAYNAAKHAVVGMVKGLAADLVGTGVTAVAVSPGSTRTAMLDATADLYGLDHVTAFAENQLLRRLLDPAEVAQVVALCCSRAGGVLTGQEIRADGGFRP
ncbi:mycofactocin-coupled SDR family oxidoreductase [Nocardioides sp. TRM66260-LWL]|uniref:mycofactocin-coupled SDR family oxidoreductase n=1 Tax=Nocardioides sp. TRM66260-LWL TaxID=2874478 RepID=UPI001CC51832|nr:mycofactocin-coupled SDR family oxidoreductase [Nocardioides sp. TRM66260-LWL]MBZ5735332.1 mycofactocin-coupled SDR family oxidoreductase [Nocardioides sp. TRM66260-LWL]